MMKMPFLVVGALLSAVPAQAAMQAFTPDVLARLVEARVACEKAATAVGLDIEEIWDPGRTSPAPRGMTSFDGTTMVEAARVKALCKALERRLAGAGKGR